MRATRWWRTLAFASVAAMIAAACATTEDDGGDPGTEDGATSEETTDGGSSDEEAGEQQEASPGLEDCEESPLTCNTGPRADGGSMTWLLNTQPGAWLAYSIEGGSVYTLQALHGIYPHTGQWAPDGETYDFNLDLLEAEPEVVSEDPFTFEFRISEDAVWSDGTPITAADFQMTWRMGTAPSEGHCDGCTPRSTAGFDRAESVEGADDGKTVIVTLKEGHIDPEWFGWFSVHGAAGAILPAHIAEEQGFDIDDPAELGEYFQWLNATPPTWSGGPYILVEGDLENQLLKEPNPAWYGEVQPTLDTLIMRIIDDEGAWVPALSNREVHGGSPPQVNEDVLRQLQERPDVHTAVGPGPSWEHLDFNLENRWLQDVDLRRAIFTAVNVEDITQRTIGSVFPDSEPKTNHMFTALSPYHEDVVTHTGHGSGDVDAALEILEGAGYEFDGSTLTLDGEQVGPFRLRSTSSAVRVTAMELIQAHLEAIGVEVVIETTDDLGGTLGSGDYDIMQFGWSGSPFFTSTPHQQWHSESGSNFGSYENAEVDELVDLARNSAELDDAAEYANQAARIVSEEAYVLPLFDSPVYLFVVDDYVNVNDNLFSSLRGVHNNEMWGVAAQ
jgi:peptide/nickel transport system substrate-binding protein